MRESERRAGKKKQKTKPKGDRKEREGRRERKIGEKTTRREKREKGRSKK